jgi:serine phosphatase RsbU (regulator of sigma subunit)
MPGLGAVSAGHGLDAVIGQVTAELLSRSHLTRPVDVAAVLARAARPLGVSAAQVYLADLQQRHLEPLSAEEGRETRALPIDSTLAGHAYQTMTIRSAPERHAGAPEQARQVWVPLVGGIERLGVLRLTVTDAGQAAQDRFRTLASLAGIMLMAKASYSDQYAQVQRSREMALQAELVWALLPPRTFATDRVLVTASLEPAYEAGGDAYDYSVHGDRLHVAIFDALGHNLSAGLLASVGMASCRSTRRSGGSLAAIAAQADRAIAGSFGEQAYVTALLCNLDLATGLLSWIPCGHPPPLLVRGRTVKELARDARPPLGLADLPGLLGDGAPDDGAPDDSAQSFTERLEPGDRVLLYTDGMTEGQSPDGIPFGLDRLAGFIVRHSSTQLPAPEAMRRLNHSVFDYQNGRLRDDATAVLVEWRPDQPGSALTP